MGGREAGEGLADPVSRCRFPLKITKRDLFFRTASGWERTLTTQNSFTNGLVLSFSSLGPQISLSDPLAYSVLAGSGVLHRAGGRQFPCVAQNLNLVPKDAGHERLPSKERKKMNIVASARLRSESLHCCTEVALVY